MKSPFIGSFAALSLVLLACSSSEERSRDPVEGASANANASEQLSGADASAGDGTPTRVPCTTTFGSALAGTFGRLDGTIVAVVSPGHGACNADAHHVHVQVLSQGQTYDVAVNTDGGFMAEKDQPLPGGAWVEGWHRGGGLEYTRDLGLHTADFTQGSDQVLDQALETAMANANHVSVFATLYSHGGVHLVHRRGNGEDGALILDPLSPSARVFAFHFSNQRF